jgi:hypothetical protein
VAARERGGERVITAERARELGPAGVQRLLQDAKGDPERARALTAERGLDRAPVERIR